MQAGERRYIDGARAVEWSFGKSSNGNEQVIVTFATDEGRKSWYGSFTEAAVDFTLEALENCGWDGGSLKTLDGMGSVDVNLVIDCEEYEGKLRERIRFINKPRAARDPLPVDAISALESRLAGKLKERRAARVEEDFKDPFG